MSEFTGVDFLGGGHERNSVFPCTCGCSCPCPCGGGESSATAASKGESSVTNINKDN
jgi:hypothetical protein